MNALCPYFAFQIGGRDQNARGDELDSPEVDPSGIRLSFNILDEYLNAPSCIKTLN
jgi:hypothetical protein